MKKSVAEIVYGRFCEITQSLAEVSPATWIVLGSVVVFLGILAATMSLRRAVGGA